MTPISHSVQAVLDLFADPLRDVRFADVDASTLTELAASTRLAAEAVEAAEAALTRARGTLQDRQDALLAHAQRALAYARVYAETDPVLTERLAPIALPRAPKRTRAEGDVPALRLEPDAAPEPAAMKPRRLRAVARSPQEDGPMAKPELTSAG